MWYSNKKSVVQRMQETQIDGNSEHKGVLFGITFIKNIITDIQSIPIIYIIK